MKRNVLTKAVLFAGLLFFISGCKSGDENKDDNPAAETGLLDNSFNSITNYPVPNDQIYARKDGTLTHEVIFPGQVVIIADGASASQINQLISQNGGSTLAQIPNAGLYLAGIDPTGLNDFLSVLYQNTLVIDAFPNLLFKANGILNQRGDLDIFGDPNSIIQVLDVSGDIGCQDNVYHKDAVGAVAGAGGAGVNINDITTVNAETDSAAADTYKIFEKMLFLLNNAHQKGLPAVINLSMGGDENNVSNKYFHYKRFCYLLEAVEKQNPHILDNAVILISVGNADRNETYLSDWLHADFPNSPIWDHFYFVGSQEGPQGCGVGYADIGTPNYLSAQACDVQIPGTACVVSGNSFSVPYVSSLVAQTHEMLEESGKTVSLPEITQNLWNYQRDHYGAIPTVAQLYSICAGDGGFDNSYEGTWSGTFYYKVEIPEEYGGPKTIETSFILTITLEPVAVVPGQPQLLKINAVTCSDASFGATMAIAPDPSISYAFLPAYFGTASASGMGIIVGFPNGSQIFTSNSLDGSFFVDQNGFFLESTSLVYGKAFSAIGTVQNSNLPGSGPGNYGYNWCTFKSWSLVRL